MPALTPDQGAVLAADLTSFTVDAVDAALGPVASAALHRDHPAAARRRLRGDRSQVAVLTRLFVLGEPVRRAELDAALPRTGTAGGQAAGLVEAAGADVDDEVRPLLDLRPHGADDVTWWLASDLGEVATGGPLRTDHVLGVGGASTTLAQWTPRTPVGSVLDVGTGCGIQTFHAARHARTLTATDVSARALEVTAFNAVLNAAVPGGPFAGRSVDLRAGSLLEPVAGQRFDLVVSNPPFVITPRLPDVPRYEYRDGGLAGDDVVRQLVGTLGGVLTDGGVAQLLGNWEHHDGQDWTHRLRGWLPDDVQAWVVQREVQDPAQYAETWARDGGHRPGTDTYQRLVGRWLDDFDARGVDAVGFGVLTLRRPRAGEPCWQRLDDLRTPLTGPMGQVVADVLAGQTWLHDLTDDTLLAARLQVAGDVTQEQHGLPGDPDPQLVLLRQGGGLGRVVRVGTALAGLVGACDGDLTVGQVVGALGVLLEEPVEPLRARLLPQVRQLLADGLLRR